MARRFRMYPRGFLGDINNVPVERSINKEFDIVKTLRNAEPGPTQYKALGESNQDITDIYKELTLSPHLTENFAFRERVLKAVIKAFGCEKINDWVDAQEKSPYYGNYHKAMVNDMIRFAYLGFVRTQALSTWDTLVDCSEVNREDFKFDEDIVYFMNGFNKLTVIEFIRLWCSRESGFSDMVITCFILFGAQRADMYK